MTRKLYRGAVAEPPFEGREIIVRGERFVVPELALGARRRLSPGLRWMYERFGASGGADKAEFADLERLHELWLEGALMALKMNYPEISAELVAEHFSLSQVRQCFEAAVGAGAQLAETARPTPAALSAAAPQSAGPNLSGAPSTGS